MYVQYKFIRIAVHPMHDTVFSTPIPALTGTHTGTKHNFGLYIVLGLKTSNRSGMHFSNILAGLSSAQSKIPNNTTGMYLTQIISKT